MNSTKLLNEMVKAFFDWHHYLEWFRQEADFGPAHGDVIDILNEQYERDTGRKVPPEWRE